MWRITAFDRDGREVASVEAAGGEVTIGREPDRTLVLPAPSVSRRHARVLLGGAQPVIVDEGSANGVLVDGVRIGGPTALSPGMQIEVAEFALAIAPSPRTETVPPIAGPPSSSVLGEDAPFQSIRLVAEGG